MQHGRRFGRRLHRGTDREGRAWHRYHLREGQDDLLSGWKLKSLIRKYSDHIVQPILMNKEEWDQEKAEQVVKDELETVNQASALWARSKNDIGDDEYKAFYKHVGHDFDEPLAWTHSRAEGRHEYTQLLYVPARGMCRRARRSTCGTATPATASSCM